LFGFYQAKEEIIKKGEAILVEGEMDMLSSFQAGVRNIAAVKGSALTEEQITMLGKVSKRLLLCFDADNAGDMAMRKAIQLAEAKGLEVKVIQVKMGKDPDECIRKGVQYWLESISDAVPYYDFLLQSAVRRHGVKNAEGKKSVVKDVLPQLSAIANLVERSHYLQRLSTLVDMPESELMQGLGKVGQSGSSGGGYGYWGGQGRSYTSGITKPPNIASKQQAPDVAFLQKQHKLEEYILALLVKMRQPVDNVSKKVRIEDIDDKSVKEVYTSYIDFFATHSGAVVEDFLRSANDKILPILDTLFLVDIPFESDEELRAELFVTIKNFKELIIREEMRTVSLEMKRLEILGDSEKQIPVLQGRLGLLFERLGKLHQLGNI
jgi:DNA primase